MDRAKIASFTAAMLGRIRPRAEQSKKLWTDVRKQVSALEGDGTSTSQVLRVTRPGEALMSRCSEHP